jgi:hypothetical protein
LLLCGPLIREPPRNILIYRSRGEGDIREYMVRVSDDGSEWRDVVRGELLSQWDRRNDIAKTLLTISSAAVVLSVTLSSPSVNPRPPKLILWPLMVAWVAFFVSRCLSIATLWVSSRLYGLGPAILEKRKELRKRIAKAPPKDTSVATDIVDDVISIQ